MIVPTCIYEKVRSLFRVLAVKFDLSERIQKQLITIAALEAEDREPEHASEIIGHAAKP